MTEKKNVLMICTDHWSANHVGAWGNEHIMTPTLDELARGGVSFQNCYSTCPVCIPSRRSLMTGLFPKSHGDREYQDRLPMPEVPTLAECFRKEGYQTMAVGKLHVYPKRNRIGFDDVLLVEEGRCDLGGPDDYEIWLGEEGCGGEAFLHGMGNNTYFTRPWHLHEKMHPTSWITRQMMKQVARRDPTRPFFFYCSYPSPHPPLVPLPVFWDMYRGMEKTPSLSCRDEWDKSAPVFRSLCEHAKKYGERERIRAIQAFYGECTHIDYSTRLLIGSLREHGLLESTILVFTSDHGEMLFSHEMLGKRSFYEESARIPLIIVGAKEELPRGSSSDRLVCLEDLMPTLLSLCRLPVPPHVQGESLLEEGKREYLYGEIGEDKNASRMIRMGDYKLIYYPWGSHFQLFDLKRDPKEQKNYIEKAGYTRIARRMKALLKENLYGSDTEWYKDGSWTGRDWGEYRPRYDAGLMNQRGLHWPLPPAKS